MSAIQIKEKYIQGCEPNHLKSYLGHPLNKYIHEARYRAIMEFLPSRGFLLDAGCGYGVFELDFLSKRKELVVVGADISGKAIRFAKSRNPAYDFVQCDIESLPFKNKVFDFVVATEVIEHVPNPLEALKEVKRVCKNLIIVTVPNVLNPSFLRIVGISYVPGFRLFSNLFSKFGRFLDFLLSGFRWTVIGYFYVFNKDFFDFKHYFGNIHRLYRPTSFLSLLDEAGLRLIDIRGTTLIPQFLPEEATKFIQFLSSIDKIIAKKRWKLSLVVTALCTAR